MAQDRFPFLADTIRVLWLDDQEDQLALYRAWVGLFPFYHFDGALTVEDAWRLVTHNAPYHVLLYDLTVPDSEGPGVALIRRCAAETACVIVTGMDRSALTFKIQQAGTVDFLRKGDLTRESLLAVVNGWFLKAQLGILPGANAMPAFQRIGEVLVACQAVSVTHLAKLARVQRSRLKQLCATHYHVQARVVLDVVRAYSAAFAAHGLCPAGTHGYAVDDVELSRLGETFALHAQAIGRFLRRGRPRLGPTGPSR
jgi:CheY-like chemotaxis protein